MTRGLRSWTMPAQPRFSSPRDLSRATYGPAVGMVAHALGKPLLPWQQHMADVALELSDADPADPLAGRFRYSTVVALVPRRAGKTVLTFAALLQRVMLAPDLFAWYTAQTRTDAAATFRNAWLPLLRPQPWPGRVSERQSNGSESIRLLHTDGLVGLFAPTPGGLHGSDSDLVVVDEAWAHSAQRGADLEVAIRPTQLTRPWRQWWVISAAGTHESTWLASWVRKGRAGTDGVAYFEWSADPDRDDLDDPATWQRVHPGLGLTASVDTLRQDKQAMDPDLFYRSYLNVTTRMNVATVLDPAGWRDCADPSQQITDRPWVALDAAPDRAAVALAMAGQTDQRRPHVGLVAMVPMHLAADTAQQLVQRYGAQLVADAAGPAGPVVDTLRQRGMTVEAPTAAGLARASGAFADAIRHRQLTHSQQPALDHAIVQAQPRKLKDTWVIDRGADSGQIALAAALAHDRARHRASLKPSMNPDSP